MKGKREAVPKFFQSFAKFYTYYYLVCVFLKKLVVFFFFHSIPLFLK